ncbi:MAG: hypothetical protein FWC68_00140, partial [Oscillospiraceae bacterium]|nr:hypothetical protein [Oscillospiraceae bacterium]
NKGIYVGLQTDCDDVFLLQMVNEDEKFAYCKSSYTGKIHPFEKEHLKHIVKGSVDIKKYRHNNTKRVIIPYDLYSEGVPLIPENKYKSQYPKTWEYLEKCKERLSDRTRVKSGEKEWYSYIYKKNLTRFNCIKILSSALCNGSRFSLDLDANMYCTCSGQGGGGGCAITINTDTPYDYYSLIGILNSKIIGYYIINKGTPQSGGYQGINKSFLEDLPIPIIKNENRVIVQNISDLVKKLHSILAHEDSQRKNDMLEYYLEEINNNVYRLYNLTEEEVKTINNEMDT